MVRALCRLVFALAVLLPMPALAGPPDQIDELAWLAGNWAGTGIGGAPAGETYSAPAGGQMVGHFYQLSGDGEVSFYELITFVPDGAGSLVLRLKHFDAAMRGWEGPAAGEALEFPLTGKAPDRWEFSAVTFHRMGEDALRITVETRNGDGSEEQLVFDLERVTG